MRVMLVSLLLAGAALAALPTASASELPVGCTSDGVGACVWQDTPNGDCVGVHFGLQGAGACADTDPVGVRACSSMRTALYDGNCPTDAVALQTSSAAQALPRPAASLCDPSGFGVGVCVHPDTQYGPCATAIFGFQGAGACVDPDSGRVRACTSMRTVVYEGFCPTDGRTILDELIGWPGLP